MATAIYPFRKIQVGEESTKGTLVAATKQIVGDVTYTLEQDFYRPAYPRGQRTTVGGTGVVTRAGTMLEVQADLSAEQAHWMLESGIRSVSPTTANGESTWTHYPQYTVYPTLKSATVEIVDGDGTTNHLARRFGYGLTSGFSWDWSANEVARATWRMFGRATAANAPTGALSPYTGLEPLTANLLSVYSDNAWANLGTTQLNAIVRSARLDVQTGLGPNYTLDGRSAKDFTGHRIEEPGVAATLDLTLELDATGMTESVTSFLANGQKFLRLKNVGSNVNTNPRFVQIDGSYRWTSPPSVNRDGAVVLVQCSLEAVYDATGANSLGFTVMSGQAAL